MAGLYAGITFSKAGARPVSDAALPTSSASTPLIVDDNVVSQSLADTLDEAAKYAAEQAEIAAKDAADKEKKAALAFGPAVRRKAAPKAKPAIAFSGGATIVGVPTVYAVSAEPSTSALPSSSDAPGSGNAAGLTGRTLVPPSMALDSEDVNGFKGTAAGKKANRNSKKKGKRRKEEDPAFAWTADYDPARPTDYNEYKVYSRIARTQRREALRRERERQNRIAAGYGGQSGSDSEYSDASNDSDAERRRRIAKAENRFFAPPKAYDDSSNTAEGPVAEEEFPVSQQSTQPAPVYDSEPVPATEAATDDWASWSATPVVSDDPYAKRMALAAGRAASQSSVSGFERLQPQSAFNSSQLESQTQIQGSFLAESDNQRRVEYPFNDHASDRGQTYSENRLYETVMLPSERLQHTANSPRDTSMHNTSGTLAAAPPTIIEEAQAKARAIAAKLAAFGKLGGPLPSTDPVNPASMPPIPGPDEPIPGLGTIAAVPTYTAPKADMNSEEFAANFMAKYGWSKGQGLGATQQGMLNPLAVSGTASAATSKKAKRKFAEAAAANKPLAKVTGMATAKGRIISDSRAEQNQSDKEKYGEPTRIVCLMNMVSRDEVDDDLSSDVAEEARKHGVLERCFIHMMPAYAAHEDSVRVFLVYSGLAGAYNAVKAFDGRFFGGRTVKAKFYDEKLAIAGNLHL